MTEDGSRMLALDVGTSSVRCYLFDERLEVLRSSREPVHLLNPEPGRFEIEPNALWLSIKRAINQALAGHEPRTLRCMALSTQRGTFITWNPRTAEYYHNFITWKDLRGAMQVERHNRSFRLRALNVLSYVAYLVTRSKRFLAGSVVRLMNGQITPRLLHELEHNERLKTELTQQHRESVRVDLLDSWLLYMLRTGGGRQSSGIEHVSDISSATATGLFDPFTLQWSVLCKHIFGIDTRLLPRVVANDDTASFGSVHASIFVTATLHDFQLPITATMSDQTAAMWGAHCFVAGAAKLTIGTGAFLNVITGARCQASLKGMYPLVAWQFNAQTRRDKGAAVYCMEGAAYDFGTVIDWAQNVGLIVTLANAHETAASVADSNGVYFVPAFSGLGPPIGDYKAACGFIGITPSATRAHLVRAIFESLVFRLVQLCQTVATELKEPLRSLRVNGGVANNDFICQFLADASGIRIERVAHQEASIVGAALMGGLNSGVFQNVQQVQDLAIAPRVFTPRSEQHEYSRQQMQRWERAVKRYLAWY